jgi:Mg-chelatase subunit ChlD
MSGLTPEEEQILQTLQAKKAQAVGSKIVHVIQVLDKSSSMDTGIDITIGAFNENLDILSQQKEGVAKTTATLITFSDADKVKAEYKESTPDRATRLHRSNYAPRGMTALYDAIGYALELSRNFEGADASAQFLLQIFTDGDENVSRRYTASKLKSMIEELNATGRWTVTVMGPRGQLDLFTKNLGVKTGNTVQFDPSSLRSRMRQRPTTS